jgi:hypothetical protein
MPTLNFPLNPTLNDTYTFEGKIWTWNGYAWKLNSASYFLDNIKTVDGSGSQLDADLLDGQDSTAFASSAQGALADSAIQPNDDAVLSTLQLTGGTGDEGTLSWNSSDKTLDLAMGEAVQQIGQEIFYMVRNETGSTIPNGTPVFANGATAGSNRVTIAGMIADGSVASMRYLGITTQDITSGVNGLVTSFGYVRDIDTRGTIYGEDWQVGEILYVSQSTAGALTNVAPTSGLILPVAIVINRHQTAGVLIVRSEAAISAPAEDGVLAKTAYSWGDHSTQDYVNDTELTNALSSINSYTDADAQEYLSSTGYTIRSSSGLSVSNLYTLDNPNAYSTEFQDQFGYSVAVSGNYAITGGHREDEAAGTNSGKAYIFDLTSGQLVHTLDNPNAYGTVDNDEFGKSFAISGNYAVVGVSNEDDADGTSSGKVYIFSVADGSLLHTLNNPNPYSTSASDYFGSSVDASETQVIISASGEDEDGASNSGKAYIFDLASGQLVHTLDNPNAYGTAVDDYFSFPCRISQSYAAVSARLEDDADGTSSGKVYIFSVADGSLLHTLNNPNPYSTSASDYFGESLAITDNYVVVGASDEDDASNTNTGKVYVFDTVTGNLLHTLENPNGYGTPAYDQFGKAAAVSGNYAIIGAFQEDDAGGTTSGKAYIFDLTSGQLVHTLDNPSAYSTTADDYFGWSVGISEKYAIVGAPFEDSAGGSASGKAYVYDLAKVYSHTLSGSGGATLNLENSSETLIGSVGHSEATEDTFLTAKDYSTPGNFHVLSVGSNGLRYSTDNRSSWSQVTTLEDLNRLSITASGAISAGDPVVLNTDGTISVAGIVEEMLSVGIFGSTYQYSTETELNAKINAVPGTRDKFIVTYEDNLYIYVVLVTMADPSSTSTSVSFGTPFQLDNTFQVNPGSSMLTVSPVPGRDGNFVIVFGRLSPSYLYAKVINISGDTVSCPGSVEFLSTADLRYLDSTETSTQDTVLLYYAAHNGTGSVAALTVNTTDGTVTLNTPTIIPGSYTYGTAIGSIEFDTTTSDTFALTYQNTTSNEIDCIIGTLSSNTVSFPASATTVTSINYGDLVTHKVAFYDGRLALVLSYYNSSFSDYVNWYVGYVSGTTPTLAYIGNDSYSTDRISIDFNKSPANTGRVTFIYSRRSGGTRYVGMKSLYIDENATTYTQEYSSGTIVGGSSSQLTDFAFFPDVTNDPGKVFILLSTGYARIGQTVTAVTYSNVSSYLGISDGTYADGETAKVLLSGSISTDQASLTTGSVYFIDTDGTISTTNTGIKAGKALSTTSLLLDTTMNGPEMNAYLGSLL